MTPHIIPIEQLPGAIERLLKDAPRVVRELSLLTGYGEAAVRIRLEILESDKAVHRVSRGTLKRGNGYYEWRSGPAPAEGLCYPTSTKGTIPQQRITDTFPPCDRRDSLVEALFGPARTSICAPDASGTDSPIIDSAPAADADLALDTRGGLMPANLLDREH